MAAPWEKYQTATPQSGGASRGGVFTLPTSARTAAKDARDAEKDAREAANEAMRIQLAQQSAAIQAQGAQLQQQEAQRKAAEWAATHNPDGSAKIGTTADDIGKLGRINSLVNQINRVQELYNTGPGSTPSWSPSSLQDYFPTDDNGRFDTAGASLAQQGLGAFRVPGTGTVSDRDAIMFDRANLPTASTRDAKNEEILLGLRARVEEELKAMGAPAPQWTGLNPQQKDDRRDPAMMGGANGAPPPMNGGNPPMAPDPWNQNSTDPTKPSSGLFLAPETRQVVDQDALALANRIIAGGGTFTDVNREAERLGMAYRVDESYNRLLPQLRAQAKGKPGFNYVQPPMKTVDNTMMQRISGGAPAAAIAGFANTATGGVVKALGGENYDAMQGAHPLAGGIGEIGGAIAGTAALGRGAGALASRFAPSLLEGGKWANRARAVGTDAAYGGIYGGVTENDPGMGIAAGAGGSILGRGVGKIGGRAIQGFTPTPASQYLATQGVDQTMGQTLGGVVKSFEDRMSSMPGIGDLVNARRMESMQDFNNAAFRQAGQPIGANVGRAGEPGLNDLQSLIGQSYDNAVSGVRVPLDPQWTPDLQAVAAASNRLPPTPRANFAQAMDNTAGVVNAAGELTGETYQNAMRSLKGYKGNVGTAAGGFDGDYRDALSLTQDALRGQMERGGGQSVVEGLGNADAAYRNYKTIADAVNRARNGGRTGEVDMFAPSQLNDAVAASKRKFPGDHPLSMLAKAGQQVLPSKIPDSGTAGRLAQLALPSAITGAGAAGGGLGYVAGGTDGAQTLGAGSLGLAALMALGGTKTGQKALKAALVDSGSLTRAGAARLIRKSGGLFGKASIPLLLEQ